MLRLVLPKGSLETTTLKLFEEAGLGVTRGSDVDYKAAIDDPRIDEVRILRPQEIPALVTDSAPLSRNASWTPCPEHGRQCRR